MRRRLPKSAVRTARRRGKENRTQEQEKTERREDGKEAKKGARKRKSTSPRKAPDRVYKRTSELNAGTKLSSQAPPSCQK